MESSPLPPKKPSGIELTNEMGCLMRTGVTSLLLCLAVVVARANAGATAADLDREFQHVIRPFVATYCIGCHGKEEPEAKFDLSPYATLGSVAGDLGHWELVRQRLRAGEMPPDDAEKRPDAGQRRQVIGWIERLRLHEAARNAGDPGPVLARRLSNAEYDYTVLDLTGVDIRPTKEFPVDPANEAGFDNSGESLAMSPALLIKHLAAARFVADHLVLLPDGLAFAPHPVVVYSDRDKFAVHRIVDFYRRQPTDYSAYFLAAWRYRHRTALGTPDSTLGDVARADKVSPKYLATIWKLLTDGENDAGPVAELRERWNGLPEPATADGEVIETVRSDCVRLREFVASERKALIVPISDHSVKQLNRSSQPIILWKNRKIAANRRVGWSAANGRLGVAPELDDTGATETLRDTIARFCDVFPDAFVVSERGQMHLDPKDQEKGRLLSAGFHLMVGYFRDDAPLYDLILGPEQQQELDRLWRELDFVTQAPTRQLSDFIYFERAERPGFLKDPEFEFAREGSDVSSEPKLRELATKYLAKARGAGINEPVLQVIDEYFDEMSASIRRLEKAQMDAEPKHMAALQSLAERAWRRPLAENDRAELAGFYRSLRDHEGLSHEDAIRDVFVSVLMSPRFSYRSAASPPGDSLAPLTDLELASRLSYFLWSSMPDDELLNQARAGDLRRPEVLTAQTRRMLRDQKIRRLATEFGGNWLDIRRFEAHNGVDRERFPNFTPELRQAMYEEPIRFFTDLVQRDGSALELLEGKHTFVNAALARHYGIPFQNADKGEWVRVDDADRFGRGGLLPMAVFLTQNSPGLRTSPVKRGYWVVRRLLGEQIPPPPPDVPELPKDEAKLGDLRLREVLAKHREVKSCAACHRRFDSIGLVFEGFGPVGERREKDLGGRPIDAAAEFPDGSEGNGLEGLKRYLRASRQADFVDNLCRKLLAYGLGRSLLLSDEPTISAITDRLAANDHRFGSLIETIVTSPQFLQKRGRDYLASRPAGR